MTLGDESYVQVLLDSVVFPVELRPPENFEPDDLGTWPQLAGRLEYVSGQLLYMPPCGSRQGIVVVDVAYLLRRWCDTSSDFLVGGNEAGMKFGRDIRGADAAVWRREDVGPITGGMPAVPPVLAVEIAGRDESEAQLKPKATWYFNHGVRVVWIVLPVERSVVVLDGRGETRYGSGQTLAEHAELRGLTPAVGDFFTQLDR